MTNSRIPSRLFYWPAFVAYSVLLYFGFTLPQERLPRPILLAQDKVVHFLTLFILMLLAFNSFFYSSTPIFQKRSDFKAATFSLLYGTYLEWAQRNVPGRFASFWDWVADLLGVLAAFFICRVFLKK